MDFNPFKTLQNLVSFGVNKVAKKTTGVTLPKPVTLSEFVNKGMKTSQAVSGGINQVLNKTATGQPTQGAFTQGVTQTLQGQKPSLAPAMEATGNSDTKTLSNILNRVTQPIPFLPKVNVFQPGTSKSAGVTGWIAGEMTDPMNYVPLTGTSKRSSQLVREGEQGLSREVLSRGPSSPPPLGSPKVSYKNVSTQTGTKVPPSQGVVMSPARKLVTGGDTVLKRSGESGKVMEQTMQAQRKAEDLMRGKFNVQIDEATRGLSKKQLSNVDQVLRGEAAPIDATTAQASSKLREMFDSIGRQAEEMKFEIKGSQGSIPFKARENYAPQMYDFTKLQKGRQRDAALKHLVESGQAKSPGQASKLLDDFLKRNAERRFGNLERAREIDLPGFVRDPKIYTRKYVSEVARRFTEAEHFGMNDEKINDLITRIANEGGDYNEAQRIFDYTTRGAPQNRVVNAVTQYNLPTQLDLSFLTNATQSINTAAKAGVWNTVKGIVRSRTKTGKELTELVGVEDNFIHLKETGVDLNRIVKAIMWPFKKVEKFNRGVAANTGVIRAEQLAQREMTEYTIRELKDLGIDITKLKNGKLSTEDMLSAAYEMTRKTQFKVDPLDVPAAWKTPTGKLVTQFKSFSFMQTKFIRDNILKEAAKGNFAPLLRFLPLAFSASYASQGARNLLTGRDPKDESLNNDIRAWDKWAKAMGDFASSYIIQAKFLADTYKSPFNTPLKKVTRTLGSIGGPTVGKFGNVLTGLEAVPRQKEKNLYLRKTGQEQDPYLELKRFFAGEVPLVGERTKNKVFAYPKSTSTPERKEANTSVYGLARELNKLPYGSPEARKKTDEYLQSITDEDERARQKFILSENGVDTKGIGNKDGKVSRSTPKERRETFEKVRKMVKEGNMKGAQIITQGMTPRDYALYKKWKQENPF